MKKSLIALPITCVLALPSLLAAEDLTDLKREIARNYADMVLASYEDSLSEAQNLLDKVESFVAKPTAPNLADARKAWIEARLPYLQTEVYRFYAGPIDDEDGPEGLLNAWPMDEAYVDYVQGDPNSGIINNPGEFPEITKDLILALNEKDGEENISSGFHAIEFLLWGQDLSATGPGNRSHEDYVSAPNAERREQYLLASTELLVDHLGQLVAEWSEEGDNYRSQFLASEPTDAVKKILTGMSMLSGFELAGERLLVAMETRSQEDEHSCFSDTTHNDGIYDAQGLVNVWEGSYKRYQKLGRVKGKGIKDLAEALDPALAKELDTKVHAAHEAAQNIPRPFDQAIGNESGRAAIMEMVEALEDQADLLVQLSQKMGFEVPITE